MNRKIKISVMLVCFTLIFSCKKEYLDTKPTASTAPVTIFETVENISLAINGINKLIAVGYYIDYQPYCGEGAIKFLYGSYPGNNYFVDLSGWSTIINGENRENTTSQWDYFPWDYYYGIIGNANSIILNTDKAQGLETKKQFVKAQALTLRAYAFFMLSQLYCKRWIDSNNGASPGLVLRLDMSTGDMPLSTLAEVYSRVYKDLDDAIALYTSSGQPRQFNYDVDKNVAYAIYARAAITRNDYAKAETMAANARNGYPLMSNSDYKSGFNTPTSEWIWSSFSSPDENSAWSTFFAYHGYNSNAAAVRTTPKCISRELFNKIPATDLRKSIFLDATGYIPTTDFSTSNGRAVSGKAMYKDAFTKYPDLFSTALIYAYMNFKFKATDLPGVGHLNHFRSSEMVLIEAEAKYFKNDIAGAQQALNTLNRVSGRDPAYSCTKSGIALLEEIKIYRALELWGEGFDWFDLKRWGDSVNRKTWANGGNFISVLATTLGPATGNNWTWMIPQRETDYNKGIK